MEDRTVYSYIQVLIYTLYHDNNGRKSKQLFHVAKLLLQVSRSSAWIPVSSNQ